MALRAQVALTALVEFGCDGEQFSRLSKYHHLVGPQQPRRGADLEAEHRRSGNLCTAAKASGIASG
jgi:hypothetical protein